MQPEVPAAHPSDALLIKRSPIATEKGKASWIIIVISILVPIGFLVGSLNYPEIFFSSWASYILVCIPPVAAFLVYYLSKKPLDQAEQKIAKLDQMAINLNNQAALYYAVLQSIKEGLIITDPKGVISFSNKKAAEILQTDTASIINLPLSRALNNEQLTGSILSDFQLELNTVLGNKIQF